jgi:hypothetical protein
MWSWWFKKQAKNTQLKTVIFRCWNSSGFWGFRTVRKSCCSLSECRPILSETGEKIQDSARQEAEVAWDEAGRSWCSEQKAAAWWTTWAVSPTGNPRKGQEWPKEWPKGWQKGSHLVFYYEPRPCCCLYNKTHKPEIFGISQQFMCFCPHGIPRAPIWQSWFVWTCSFCELIGRN